MWAIARPGRQRSDQPEKHGGEFHTVSSTVSACGGEGSGFAAMQGETGSGEAGIQPQS
jgi:hypothetical protein